MIYETIYRKLDKLTGGIDRFLRNGAPIRLKASGFMDLVIEPLGHDTISMTHYFTMNGDLVSDLDMGIRIFQDRKMAEALTYQDMFRFQAVYPEENRMNPMLKKNLNLFLLIWLSNIEFQGFMGSKNHGDSSF